jgi:hypothetical protein
VPFVKNIDLIKIKLPYVNIDYDDWDFDTGEFGKYVKNDNVKDNFAHSSDEYSSRSPTPSPE